MCVRDKTRSAKHLGIRIKTNGCRAGEDVPADVSVPGTSQPVVSSSTICSCAFNIKPCDAASMNIWQRKGTSTAVTLSHATMHVAQLICSASALGCLAHYHVARARVSPDLKQQGTAEMPYSVVRSTGTLIATGLGGSVSRSKRTTATSVGAVHNATRQTTTRDGGWGENLVPSR